MQDRAAIFLHFVALFRIGIIFACTTVRFKLLSNSLQMIQARVYNTSSEEPCKMTPQVLETREARLYKTAQDEGYSSTTDACLQR